MYRLRKIARKNRAALVTVGSFAVLLLVGAVLSSLQAIRATRAEAAAISQAKRAMIAEEQSRLERDRAVAAEAQAKGEGEKAERSAAEARAVLGFFQDQVLSAARPEGMEGGLGKDVTIRKAVDVAEPKIAGAFPDQPTTEASVRSVLGRYLLLPGRTGSRGPATGASAATSNGRVRSRSPRHTREPEQPRPGLLGRRPA